MNDTGRAWSEGASAVNFYYPYIMNMEVDGGLIGFLAPLTWV